MKPSDKQLIIVPDVHGRTFWKEAIPFVNAGTPCIFLGDYVDPYRFEGISDKDALHNLHEIIHFTASNRDRVTLLLGNHDLSYFGTSVGQWNVYADRFCYELAESISLMFNTHKDLFSLCSYRQIGGKPFLFSHAGMHPLWVDECGLFDSVDRGDAFSLANRVNELYLQSLNAVDRTDFMDALATVGHLRGGDSPTGSMVWADCHEYNDTDCQFTQIFGHTAQRTNGGSPYSIAGNICVDCSRCFYLNSDGQLYDLKNNHHI